MILSSIHLFGSNWVKTTWGATTIYVDGYAEYDGIAHNAKQLAVLLLSLPINDIEAAVKQFNGIFVIIAVYQGTTMLISDSIRSKTLQYAKVGNKNYITDNILELSKKEQLNLEVDNDKLEELVVSCYVYGYGTVYKNVYALQVGEIVIITDREITRRKYFLFTPTSEPSEITDYYAFSNELDEVLMRAFHRMFRSTPNVNRWIVPLSGGHDSRIVVNYLYKLGVKNVICFTYGMVDNLQARISRQVAEALNFPWYFVEYTEEKWNKLHEDNQIEAYFSFAFDGMSTPHLQDFLAVHELKQNKIFKAGDIFVPGHLLDALAGAYLQKIDFDICDEQAIIKRAMVGLTKRVASNDYVDKFKILYDNAHVEPSHFYELLGWQERTAKTSAHSVRVYQFFGFDYRLPFLDNELVRFWLRTPKSERLGRNALLKAEKRGLLLNQIANIPFAGRKGIEKHVGLKKRIRKILPPILISLFIRYQNHKPLLNEALNQIYTLKATTVKDLLAPHKDFPANIFKYFKHDLYRYTYQIEPTLLTTLYFIRKVILKRSQ